MALDPRKEFKYKIHPRTIENIEGELTHIPEEEDYDFGAFEGNLNEIHMMNLDENGHINNPDGCYYFNDPDELIFPKATNESKIKLRKAIEANMIPADQEVED